MKFVIIFGPPAVGKMTVGYELAKLTGLKLFHNHMTIDLVLNFFEFGAPQFQTLVGEFRRRIFEEVAASDLHGLIFTLSGRLIWNPRRNISSKSAIFSAKKTQIFILSNSKRIYPSD